MGSGEITETTIFHFSCGRCNAKLAHITAPTAHEAKNGAYHQGWRVTFDGWTCPTCLEKDGDE